MASPRPVQAKKKEVMSYNLYLSIWVGIALCSASVAIANEKPEPVAQESVVQSAEAYKTELLEKNKLQQDKFVMLRARQTEAAERKEAMINSDPACMELAAEVASLETQRDAKQAELDAEQAELDAKQAELDALIANDPEIQRLRQEAVKAEADMKQVRTELRDFIRERKKLEWGAK